MVSLTQKKPIILASTSPLRRELLEAVALKFDVIASPFDEEAHKDEIVHLPIPQQAQFLANGKAEAVSAQYPEHLVIAADQIGECDGVCLFKPGSRSNAINMLALLQGRAHFQHCAACVFLSGKKLVHFVDTVKLAMRQLSLEEISCYVDWDKPYACCGSYRYEGLGKYLFASVDGAYESVLGLPLLKLLNFLQDEQYIQLL
jgi:septum formation protein